MFLLKKQQHENVKFSPASAHDDRLFQASHNSLNDNSYVENITEFDLAIHHRSETLKYSLVIALLSVHIVALLHITNCKLDTEKCEFLLLLATIALRQAGHLRPPGITNQRFPTTLWMVSSSIPMIIS